MLAALCALPATGQEEWSPFRKVFDPDSSDFHDLLIAGGGGTLGSSYSQAAIEFFGIGYGPSWIDVHSSMRASTYFGVSPGDTNRYFMLSSVLLVVSTTSAFLFNDLDIRDKGKSFIANMMMFSAYACYPEIRLFPMLPVYPVAGYNLDLAFSPKTSTFKPVAGVRAGLNLDLLFLRVRGGYDATWVGSQLNKGPYLGLGLFFGSFHSIMSF